MKTRITSSALLAMLCLQLFARQPFVRMAESLASSRQPHTQMAEPFMEPGITASKRTVSNEDNLVCNISGTTTIVAAKSTLCYESGTVLSLSDPLLKSPDYTFEWQYLNPVTGLYTIVGTSETLSTGPLNANASYKCKITCTVGGTNFTTPVLTLTVNPPEADVAIVSDPNFCLSSSFFQLVEAYVDGQPYDNVRVFGTWSSSDTSVFDLKIIGSSVFPVVKKAGKSIVSFTATGTDLVTFACPVTAQQEVSVTNGFPVDPIQSTGGAQICSTSGGTLQLTNTTLGGVWTSSETTIATVNANGLVQSVGEGTATIYYSVTDDATQCTGTAVYTVAIGPPQITTETGANQVCIGTTFQLSNVNSGGTWSSSNTAVATVDQTGLVTGIIDGTVNVTYTFASQVCSLTSISTTLAVGTPPVINPITSSGNTNNICSINGTLQLSNATTGGNWASDDETIATVDVNGLVSGVAAGETIIYYLVDVGSGCPGKDTFNIIIGPPQSSPTAVSVSRCGPGTVTLNATPPPGATVAWYSSATSTNNNNLLSTANPYTPPSISATTTYWVESRYGTCRQDINATPRTAVTATVNAIPAAPTAGAAASRCGTGTVTINALPPSGSTVDWYALSAGGTAIATNANSYTTPSLSATTNYFAEARNTTTSCISSTRLSVAATINALPAAATSPVNASRCGAGSVTVSATAATGTTIDWYTATTGGTKLQTGTAAGVNSYTATISATTTYYAETRNLTTGCVSSTRVAVTATVGTAIDPPTGSPASRCGTGTVTISATPPAGATIVWFSAATGGTQLATTNAYTTPSIAASTTYFAESQIGSTCKSATRTAVTATVNTIPAAPTAGTAGSRCGTGTVLINATTPTGITVDWYAATTGGTILPNGTGTNSFTTPSISATTNYFAQARNAATTCTSATRLTVAATVNALPAAPTSPVNATRCGTGTVTLSATAATGTTVDWYNALTGGTRLQAGTAAGVNNYTPTVSATTTFYVEARNLTTGCVSSPRIAVTATVTSAPTAPIGSGAGRCGPGTVTISATPPSGATIAWFSTSTGGTTPLATTNTYTTPSLTASTTYFAESRIGTTCISATRTAVVAAVNAIPAAPTAGAAGSRCGTGTVVINATTPSGITVDWYAATTGGTVLPNGTATNSFTTPSISATTNYFAQARNAATTCTSATRLTVTATVNPQPALPASPVNTTRCGSGSVTISATAATGTTIDWYAASTGGTRLQAGTVAGVNNYTTTVSATTTFFAETRNLTTGCVSATRVAVTANVVTTLDPPTGTGTSRCGAGTVTLTATPPSGTTIAWFSAASGGTPLATTTTYTTPSLTNTTTYYAESQIAGSCTSATRTPITATINTIPNTPTAGTPGSRCGPGTVLINAVTPTGVTVDWYAAATGGTVLTGGTGTNSFTTPSITATTSYYAQARNATTTCVSTTRLTVTATVNALPTAPASISVTGGTSRSGTLSICPVLNTNYTYTAAAVTGAVAYKWTIPVCATPSTTPISTTNTVAVRFTGARTADSMKVQSQGSNGCLSTIRGVRVTSVTTCAACTAPVAGTTSSIATNSLLSEEENLNVKVFPNPSKGLFNVQVQSPERGEVQIKVVDNQGRLVRELKTNPYSIKVIGLDLSPGLYILKITQGSYQQSVKIVKE